MVRGEASHFVTEGSGLGYGNVILSLVNELVPRKDFAVEYAPGRWGYLACLP